jgi:hypothetical protein
MHLAGRRAAARLDLGQHVVAIVLRDIDGSGGTIALWHDSPSAEMMRISIFLGSRTLQKADLQGNVELVPVVDGLHELTIGREPVFLDEADLNLALFRSGFSIDPPFIEGATARHLHHFVLTNPWPTAIAGTMRIIEPANWEIQERIRRILIASGEELRLPIVFNYPAFETAGPKRFVVDITLDSSSSTTVRMEAIAELGLEQVRLVPQMSLETTPDGKTELVITHSITNRSEEPVWLTAFTVAEGYGRQEYDVARLSPGESTLRVFRISDPWKNLLTPMIRIGLRERGGSKQINMLLDTNPLREEDGQPRLPMVPVE